MRTQWPARSLRPSANKGRLSGACALAIVPAWPGLCAQVLRRCGDPPVAMVEAGLTRRRVEHLVSTALWVDEQYCILPPGRAQCCFGCDYHAACCTSTTGCRHWLTCGCWYCVDRFEMLQLSLPKGEDENGCGGIFECLE